MNEQLEQYLDTLERKEIDAFAKEYYGISIDGRLSKPKMIAKLLKETIEIDPLKQLPYEELLLEDKIDETVVEEIPVEEDTIIETVDEEEETKSETVVEDVIVKETKVNEFKESFIPFKLPFKYYDKQFIPVDFAVIDVVKSVLSGDKTLEDCDDLVKSLVYYVEKEGSVLVRETRNSAFITITK